MEESERQTCYCNRERESDFLTLPFAGMNEVWDPERKSLSRTVSNWGMTGNDRTDYWLKSIMVTGCSRRVLYGRNGGRKVKGRRSLCYDSGACGYVVIVVAGPPWRILVWKLEVEDLKCFTAHGSQGFSWHVGCGLGWHPWFAAASTSECLGLNGNPGGPRASMEVCIWIVTKGRIPRGFLW